ncbi:MAG: transketolase [Vampirovibrionales bacterium]|nr:transketolase [Vampirovibrionales bacterium]
MTLLALESESLAKAIRRLILETIARAKASHVGSCLSIADILAVLYGQVLNVRSNEPSWLERDRVILSKGHAAVAIYATLAECGFFPKTWLDTYSQDGSLLGGHVSWGVPGVEAATGALGHGLNIGAGLAIAFKRAQALALRAGSSPAFKTAQASALRAGPSPAFKTAQPNPSGLHDAKDSSHTASQWPKPATPIRTYVILSDGECDEGSTWEAALFAAHHGLNNLMAIVDYNKIQSFGRVDEVLKLEPFADKWRAFGWHVIDVDGHDHAALLAAFEHAKTIQDKPQVLIAHTTKGKGVGFMEDDNLWHYRPPNSEQLVLALEGLNSEDEGYA